MSKYSKLSLKKELADTIRKFIDAHPEYGYRSLAQFIEDAIRRRADELGAFDFRLSQVKLPNGFVEWIRKTGVAEQITCGKKDIIEALREWKKDTQK